MSAGPYRAVVVGMCVVLTGVLASCELLVELDRSAVVAGGSEGGDEGEDAADDGADGSAEAGTTDSGADAVDADVARETSTTDSSAGTEE